MTLKEYLRQPNPELEALAIRAEFQRMNDEDKLFERRLARRREAFKKYKEAMRQMWDALYWAHEDKLCGDREAYLEDMRVVAYCRIQALEWYARYRKICNKMRGE